MKAYHAIIVFLLLTLAYVFVLSLPIYFLWNWLMPSLFHLPKIEYLQCIGLLFIIMLARGFFSNG